MDFREAENYLYSLGNEVETMKLGLENITALLSALGEPQKNYLKVQVAGTNGKGSVCAFLDSICREAGIRTGLFTSPHLISIRERVKICGEDIGEEEFARLASVVRGTSESLIASGTLDRMPTFFEQITAIGLLAFAAAKVELAILETGLGGRFDATTAAGAEIAAITRIDLDHQEYLGDTIEKIAAEKAAIISDQTEEVVIGEQSRVVMAVLRERCREIGIEPVNDGYHPWCVFPDWNGTAKGGLTLSTFAGVRLGLRGRHQIENAQTAVRAAEALMRQGAFLHLDGEEREARIIAGLEKARHPGRLESIGQFLLDGAHNPGGAAAVRAFLDEFVTRPVTLVFGAMREKNVLQLAEILFPKAVRVILTRPENSRALSAEEIAPALPAGLFLREPILTDSVREALELARNVSPPDGLIVVTGSLYLVGEAKKILAEKKVAESHI